MFPGRFDVAKSTERIGHPFGGFFSVRDQEKCWFRAKDELPDLVDGGNLLGLKRHDHDSMIPTATPSGSLPLETKTSLQAHVPLEEANAV